MAAKITMNRIRIIVIAALSPLFVARDQRTAIAGAKIARREQANIIAGPILKYAQVRKAALGTKPSGGRSFMLLTDANKDRLQRCIKELRTISRRI